MPEFGDLLVVVVVAFAAPFALGLFPRLRMPSVVLEIIGGIVMAPRSSASSRWDQSIEVVALIGLAFVIFLAGLEIEFDKLAWAGAAADRCRVRALVRDRTRGRSWSEGGRPCG